MARLMSINRQQITCLNRGSLKYMYLCGKNVRILTNKVRKGMNKVREGMQGGGRQGERGIMG